LHAKEKDVRKSKFAQGRVSIHRGRFIDLVWTDWIWSPWCILHLSTWTAEK